MKHPCKVQGCSGLTDTKYCDKHQHLLKQERAEYDRTDKRKEINKRYNNTEWRKLRNNFLIEHPFCVECKKNNRVVKATAVHHVIELSQGGTNDWANLCPLCHYHHNKAHVERLRR